MSVNLIKLAVGIETVDHLRERQAQRVADMKARGEAPRLRILTRNTPRRAEEILAGGSLYWVVKGQILVRQVITAIEQATNSEGSPRCAIFLDAKLVRVQVRRSRPFQGWRYLEPDNAPPDIRSRSNGADRDPPPEMAAELRELGLI